MTLLVDTSSIARRLGGQELTRWAETHSAFISSEMQALVEERVAVGTALRELGMAVVAFEHLGGRDEDAVTAYLDGVGRSDVYVGIVGDRYGRMLPSGRSPTHEEYLKARELGKRISVWVASAEDERQGNARDFVQEVETFHTTGRFSGAADLAQRVVERMAELAADDDAPSVKVGDAVLRASLIRDSGQSVQIEAEVRDQAVVNYLEGLRGGQWGGRSEITITTQTRTGLATIERVASERRSTTSQTIEVEAAISWADGSGNSMAAGTGGYSPEDLAEVGIRAGLLREPVPADLGSMDFMVDTTDPMAELDGLSLAESSFQSVARLLIVESLVAERGAAASIDRLVIGPEHLGERPISLTYTAGQRYANEPASVRTLEGTRPSGG